MQYPVSQYSVTRHLSGAFLMCSTPRVSLMVPTIMNAVHCVERFVHRTEGDAMMQRSMGSRETEHHQRQLEREGSALLGAHYPVQPQHQKKTKGKLGRSCTTKYLIALFVAEFGRDL